MGILFYLISDDISDRYPSRFYTAKLDYDEKEFNSIKFTDEIYLRTPSKNIFPFKNELLTSNEKEIANAESIRYNKETNSLFWTSEGLNKIDNIEGMCWGKEFPNGKKSIVFVSDDNFNYRQIFQILVFEVGPDLL